MKIIIVIFNIYQKKIVLNDPRLKNKKYINKFINTNNNNI